MKRPRSGAYYLEAFDLLPEEDFAAMLGVTVKTLKNRPRAQLPEFVKVGHRRLFKKASVKEFLDRHGIAVEIDHTPHPSGRFAQLYDPEGNAVQLGEPA